MSQTVSQNAATTEGAAGAASKAAPPAPPRDKFYRVGAEEAGKNEYTGIPDLDQLLSTAGYPGVTYCLTLSDELGEMTEMGWWQIPNMPTLTLHGPGGSSNSVMLLAHGTPIPGAAPANGRRRYYARPSLLAKLGYKVDGPSAPAPVVLPPKGKANGAR